MKLAVFNGSPRAEGSNTSLLLEHFIKGFTLNGGKLDSYDYLIKEKKLIEQIDHFKSATAVFLAFPLYVDSLPGIVKNFIEKIGNFNGEGKKILFLVHSGFPEGIHSEGVSKYLELLSLRWNMENLGVIIKPGSEAIKMRPISKSQKLFQDFEQLGSLFSKTGKPDREILDRMKQPYRLPGWAQLLVRLLKPTGMNDSYWIRSLKKNNAYKNHSATPYASG